MNLPGALNVLVLETDGLPNGFDAQFLGLHQHCRGAQ